MDTITAPRFVKAVTCTKCGGDGTYRDVRACSRCSGIGTVEGDRPTIAARNAAAEARRSIRTFAVDAAIEAGMHRVKACHLVYVLDHLEANAPERHARALVSHAAGHPGLLAAIVTYGAEQGLLRHGTRPLTVPAALALIGA